MDEDIKRFSVSVIAIGIAIAIVAVPVIVVLGINDARFINAGYTIEIVAVKTQPIWVKK